MAEAARIVILRGAGVVDVAAPMKHKDLCYDLLRQAKAVMRHTGDEAFISTVTRIIIVLDMTGRVDVAAPMPSREMAEKMLDDARAVIERYNEASAPPQKAFPRAILGER